MSTTSCMFKRTCGIFLCITLLITGAWGDCSVPGKPDYAELPDLNKDSFPIGSTVQYTCRPGFVRKPGTKATITCLDDDTWSVPVEFCKRKSCGNPGDILNGDMEAEDFLFGSRVTYKCNEGYILSNKRNYRDCQADGQWSNILPICEAVICSPPEKPANGFYDPQKDEYSYSDAVTFTCNKGLEIVGESSATCSADGTWNPSSPSCTVVKCLEPKVPNSRRLSGFVGPYTLNHAVRFECVESFVMKGSNTITCNISSQWEPEIPQCLTVCGPPPTLSFAVPDDDFTNQPNYFNGTKVKYSCNLGYEPDPSKSNTITCSDKRWSIDDQFCSRISCGKPSEIENSKMTVKDFLFGSHATYHCLEGYGKKSGLNYRECQANGMWSIADIVCKDVCDHPPKLTGAVLGKQPDHLTHHFINTSVEYKCEEGYEHQPNKIYKITCLGKMWSEAEEFCLKKSNVPIIVGTVIAIVVVCGGCLLIWYIKKQKQSRKLVSNTPDVHYTPCDA